MSRDQHPTRPDSSLGKIAQGIQEDPTLDPESERFLTDADSNVDTLLPPSDILTERSLEKNAITQDPNAPIAEINTLPPLNN